jgi:hypothetical protein
MRILLLLVLLSCGTNKVIVSSQEPVYIEYKLRQYYNRYMQYATAFGLKIDCSDLSIYSTDENPDNLTTLAVAINYSNGSKRIIVYNYFWDIATEVSKEILVFHEISHACQRQQHRNNSIMQESLLDEAQYLFYYNYFVKELFGQQDSQLKFIYLPY